MTDLLLVYITCQSKEQADMIGAELLKKRLCACLNIIPGMESKYFWPPKTDVYEMNTEVILIAKTIESKYQALEEEVKQLHSYDNPCILAIPVVHVRKDYYDWLIGELSL
jgi:periplasmic divalent cation tolerance protein